MNNAHWELSIVDFTNLDIIFSRALHLLNIEISDPNDFLTRLNSWSADFPFTHTFQNSDESIYFLFHVDGHPSNKIYLHHFSPYIQYRLKRHSSARDMLLEMDTIFTEII